MDAQSKAASCQRTDVPTTMQQSKAACQRTDVPTTMQHEAQVPALSAVALIMGISAACILFCYILLQRHHTGNSPQGTGAIETVRRVGGQQNPTIVGAGHVIFQSNSPPDAERAGVPLPRTQHNERPDQEPRLGAPSYQDVGNKTRDILKRFYTTEGSHVQLLPGVDRNQMPISRMYTKVKLERRKGLAFVTGGNIINSTEYAKIFKLRKRVKRLIFFGMGGVGKSTIFDKIAYDWADEASEVLKKFKLVFLLKMCALSQESDLVDSAFDQLLDEDAGIAKDELRQFIVDNQDKVLILFDGFDEMRTKTLDAFASVRKALNRKIYRECYIGVSTRTSHLETLMSKSLVQNPCTHVEVLGFTDEDVNKYVCKFYDEDPDSGKALIHTIEKSNTLHDFAETPMLLMHMCSLWRENNFPKTMSPLFTEAVHHMFTRKQDIFKEDATKTVISIGQTALRGLMSANQKFSFQEDDFEPTALELALKAGVLTQPSIIKNDRSYKITKFMHNTIQIYCVAKYLQSVHISNQGFLKRMIYKLVPFGEFKNNLERLCHTVESVKSNDTLLRFCCGDNVTCMTDIVQLLDRNFMHPSSASIQPRIRNYMFESQSKKVPQCLTSDSLIPSTIVVRNNYDFCSLVYLLEIICRSNSPMAQLAHVENIQVSSVVSVRDFAFALGYMENLTCLRLSYCPSLEGDLKEILSLLKCNKLLTRLSICDCNKVGSRAIEWVPHIKHLNSLKELEIRDCKLQRTDIEHIVSAVAHMPELTNLILN